MKHNIDEIKFLLDKFYEGDTTLEEEAILTEFFEQSEVPRELLAEAAQFKFYNEEAAVTAPDIDFEAKLVASIEQYEANRKIIKSRNIIYYSSAAAVVLIALTVYLSIFRSGNDFDNYIYNNSDPEVAYYETARALQIISESMEQATRDFDKLNMVDQSFSIFGAFSLINLDENNINNN